MTSPVFLATLGQRPEAITMALDALLRRYGYAEVGILHTDPQHSSVATACTAVLRVLKTDYRDLNSKGIILCYSNGQPLTDINDQHSAEAYYLALLEVIRQYRAAYVPVHLLVAGGRKAMSIYAALAARLLFGEHDRLWTVHTPRDLMQIGVFHAPAGMQDRVQLIQLPVTPSRFLPGVLAGEDAQHLLERSHTSPRELFQHSLTDEESKLAETLRQQPYAGNVELGNILGKSPKTIENQLRTIYGKLFTYFDLNIEDKRKRQVLLDVLAGRV